MDFDIDFADSNLLSYRIEGRIVTFILERWNAEILEFKFLNFASLYTMNYYRISEFKEVFESPLLDRVFKELYDEIPKEHNLKIFKFLNSNEMTVFEIVCEDISIKIVETKI